MPPQERRSLTCCCGILGGGGSCGGCIFDAEGSGAGVCVKGAIGWHGCVALGNGWGSLPGSGVMVRIQSINMAEICVSWLAFLDSSLWSAKSPGGPRTAVYNGPLQGFNLVYVLLITGVQFHNEVGTSLNNIQFYPILPYDELVGHQVCHHLWSGWTVWRGHISPCWTSGIYSGRCSVT